MGITMGGLPWAFSAAFALTFAIPCLVMIYDSYSRDCLCYVVFGGIIEVDECVNVLIDC
ncbi:hypothetical protein ES705_31415 [subsurface metagenome]